MKITLGRSGWLALTAALAVFMPISSGIGATYTWTGTGAGNNWYTTNATTVLNSNWDSPGSTLSAIDTVVFGTSSKTTATINNSSATTITGLLFDVGAPAYTIGGGNGAANLTVTGSIVNNSSNLQTITTNGAIGFANGMVIDTGASGITISRNSVSPNTANIGKQGSGTLTWANASSYTGTMTVTAGAFDGGSATFGGSIVNSSTVSNISNLQGTFTQTAGVSSIINAQAAVDISGGSSTITNVQDVLTVSGGTLTAGTLNDFTTLSGGVLQMTSPGGFIAQNVIQTGGYLTTVGGTAGVDMGETLTISSGTADIATAKVINSTSTGVVNLFNGASVSQASSLGGVTNISGTVGSNVAFAQPLTLASGGNFNFDISGLTAATALADNISANGGVAYGGTMSINLTSTGTAVNGTDWDLITSPLKTGTLDGMSLTSPTYGSLNFGLAVTSTNIYDQRYGNGMWLSDWSGGQRFIFSQQTGTLTVVPEPSTIVFAGIGAAMLSWQTWAGRRRKARMKLIEEHTRKLSEQRGLA